MTSTPESVEQVKRFRLCGKTYTTAALDEITLKDLLVFQRQTTELGVPITWSEVQQLAQDVGAKGVQLSDDRALLMLAIVVWATRRVAGEDVTFADAIDFPMKDLEWIDGPKKPADHKAKAGPTKRPGGKKSSGRAADPAPVEQAPETSTTSSEQSASA